MSNNFLNFKKNSSKFPSSLIFLAYLSLADLEGGFIFISSAEGKIAFLLIRSKILFLFFDFGKYREIPLSSE